MANEEHRTLLLQGVDVWNEWRKNNPDVNPDLSCLSFSGINLNGFNLCNTVLWGSNFGGSSLRGALLTRARLQNTYLLGIDLTEADLRGASLSGANLTAAILREADVRGADLSETNLSSAYLVGANLHKANLTRADLVGANLTGANLSEAVLLLSRAASTNFERAILTGACIQDWKINERTNLNGLSCDYIYWQISPENELVERCPPSGNFAPGDFAKLVQDSLETVALIFHNGVDWKAFAYSFKNTQVLNEDTSLAIQSIENKGDGVVLIRVSLPKDADKTKIHENFWQGYEFLHRTLEAQYQARIDDKDKEINRLFHLLNQAQEKLGEVPKLMAETSKVNMSFHGPVGSAAGEVKGDQKTIQHNYAAEQKKTLSEAAAEIQQLLTQLQTKGYSPEKAQQQVAKDLAQQAQSNPTVKNKLVKWGQYVSDAAANGIIGDVAVEVIKLALRLANIPIP